MQTDRNHIQNNQMSFKQSLTSIPRPLRLLIGFVLSALIAFYIPLAFIILTGSWFNTITYLFPNLIVVLVIIVMNCIGNLTKRPILFWGSILLALDLYIVQYTISSHTFSNWRHWWQNVFFANSCIPLNVYLLYHYQKAADLNTKAQA